MTVPFVLANRIGKPDPVNRPGRSFTQLAGQ
jgi:hypothetical protein